MTIEDPNTHEAESPEFADWSEARPLSTPRPTFYPAALAFAITLGMWGFIASPVLLVAGFLLIVTSLAGWIGEICRE